MILFEKDLIAHNAHIHLETKNESFKKMSKLLRLLGVKNNVFFLALLNPELRDIDPHDRNLTPRQISMIAMECALNPWYFFREVVRIPQQGAPPCQFRLDRATLALVWTVFNDLDAFITVPRQICKTVTSLTIIVYFLYIGATDTSISMLTKDKGLIQRNIGQVKDIRDNLPSYMIKQMVRDADNKEGLSYRASRNELRTYVARMDTYGADNLGRGMSTPIQLWDEFGYFINNHISYPVAVASTNHAVDTARAAGNPAFNIIATTAAMLNEERGEFAYSVMSDAMRFSEKLYDCMDKTELTDLVKTHSITKMLYITYSFLQLGKDHDWLRDKTARTKSSADQIDTDFLCIWKQGNENSVIPEHLLKKIKASQLEPHEVEIRQGYLVRWYVPNELRRHESFFNKPFIIGMDCSENIGADFTSFIILDPTDMSVVATCRCNEVNLIRIGLYVVDLLVKFKQSIFIPERNSTGVTILDVVLTEFEKLNINPYTRIYNTAVQNKHVKEFKDFNIYTEPTEGINRKYFGFRTHGGQGSNTRHLLYRQVLSKAVELNHHKIHDATLIDEMSQLSVRNGRIDHKVNKHDDTVVAYLLACYLVFEGENLHLYGIDRSVLCSKMVIGEAKDVQERDHQLSTIAKINEIEERMKYCNSEFIRLSYNRRIKELRAQLDDSIIQVDPISTEQMKAQSDALRPVKSFNMRAFQRLANVI